MSKIKYLVMDVDGTLTDGKIYMGVDGELCKVFNIKDGCGIHDIAISNGIIPIIITGRKSKITENRAKEIGVTKMYQGVANKWGVLSDIITDITQVAYIGDDINDMDCMMHIKEKGGIIGCPNDAVPKIREIADYICEHNGGDGAVRDYIEWIVERQGIKF